MNQGIVELDADVFSSDGHHELVLVRPQPIEPEQHKKKMPGMTPVVRESGEIQERRVGQSLTVAPGQGLPSLPGSLHLGELTQPEGRVEVGEAVVVPRLVNRVAPGAVGVVIDDPVVAKAPQALDVLNAVGHDRSALS